MRHRKAHSFGAPCCHLLALRLLACWLVVQGMAVSVRAETLDIGAVAPSVPRILNFSANGACMGTGFVVGRKEGAAVIATNQHVVADRRDGILVFRKAAGGIEKRFAEVVWEDEELDLALLLVPGLRARPLQLLEGDPPPGEDAYAVGYPGMADQARSVEALITLMKAAGDSVVVVQDPRRVATRWVEVSVAKGAVRRTVTGSWWDNAKEIRIVEHDANIMAGNSGGPLVDKCGRVIGVNTQRAPDSEIPVDVLRMSSHASELTGAMRQLGIRPLVASGPCSSAAGAMLPPNWLWLAGAAGAAAVALVLLRGRLRPATVPPALPSPMPQGAAGVSTPSPTARSRRRDAPASHGKVLATLAGANPEHPEEPIAISLRSDDFEQYGGRLVIGRKRGVAQILISNTSISGQHAAVHCDSGQFFIEDRKSSNGTRLNGQPLKPFQRRRITPGDSLQIGEVRLEFREGI